MCYIVESVEALNVLPVEDILLPGDNIHVKTLRIQLNPKPTVRDHYAMCQHCGQHLIPMAYRVRTNSKSVWHVRCYEDVYNLERELVDNYAVLSIDENQIDVEALAYIYQWEADVLGVDGGFIGAYAAAVLSNHRETCPDNSYAASSQLVWSEDDGHLSHSDLDVTYVLDAGSGDECSGEESMEEDRPFYDGFNQPIADYYLNRPLQPIANGCFASVNIGPAVEREGNVNEGILIPRFPARLSELLDSLEKKQNRTLRDHAVFMFR
ncbi:hypothetical protein BDQ17DRAFT_931954 [Cyathus striatus]|nr:hypothetical protein BDQ17DRAFT_931954 [Cyathus striatus]